MKSIRTDVLAAGVCLLALTVLAVPAAAELPFGVKPQEIEVAFSVTPEPDLQVGIGEGHFPGPDDNKPNKRWGIKIGEINYRLKFWNVGAEGGSSGYLLWKKNYADAVLQVSWEPETAGYVNGPAEDIKSPITGKIMRNTWHVEAATAMPEFGTKTYSLRFTGGPNGAFTEVAPYKGRNPVTGRVINGKKVEIVPSGGHGEFGEPIQSDVPSSTQPFFGWETEFDESEAIYAVLISGTARIQQFASSESTADAYGNRPVDPGGGISFIPNKKTLVKVGNQIATGPDTRVVLHFPDNSEFRVKSNTIIQVVDGGIILRVGDTRVNLQKQGKKFEVHTPTAVTGPLGTIFVVSVAKDGSSSFHLIEGKLATSDRAGKKQVKTSAGESISADRGGLGDKRRFDVAALEREWASGWEIAEKSGALSAETQVAAAAAVCIAVAAVVLLKARARKRRSNLPVEAEES